MRAKVERAAEQAVALGLAVAMRVDELHGTTWAAPVPGQHHQLVRPCGNPAKELSIAARRSHCLPHAALLLLALSMSHS
jgi:hypothetical protein